MHYIGRIQYWANAILGEYNIGRIQYWANAIRPYNYPPVSVRAYRILPFTYTQNYIITTLHVMFFGLVVWFGFRTKT